MALPTELQKIKRGLELKTSRRANEENLLRELRALDERLLNENVRSVEANVQKMTSPDSACPCCGR